MPLTFDPHFMACRLLAASPNALFMIVVNLRLRRILPLALRMADGRASAFVGTLWPMLR